MKCPHCLNNFHDSWQPMGTGSGNTADSEGSYVPFVTTCPSCAKVVLKLRHNRPDGTFSETLVIPKAPARSPLPPEVPRDFAADYGEACLVLADSPKASAALSRRSLQHLLREQFKVNHGALSEEIDQVLETLPSHLADAVDAIRNVGNFAAHPMKSTNTAEIIDVEPGEAEWCLDVLESLFDFAFIQPELLRKKREALNQKLAEAGRPVMK